MGSSETVLKPFSTCLWHTGGASFAGCGRSAMQSSSCWLNQVTGKMRKRLQAGHGTLSVRSLSPAAGRPLCCPHR